jgi:peptide/nickel transport system substrate-binding protein
MRQRWWVIVLAAGVALLITAFAASPSGSAPARGIKEGGVLRVNVSDTDVQYLDPALDYEFIGWGIENATCAKLLNYPDKPGPAGATLIPEAAAGMPRLSRDGKTYTIRIRPGFKFNTGEEVTAETFAHAFDRVLHPKMQSPGASFLHDLVGADRVLAGKAKRASGIQVRGNTLTIRLTSIAPDFVPRLAMNFFCAVPRDFGIDPKGTLIPAAAGPFYVERWARNRQVVLKRNPNYAGRRPVHLDEIRISVDTNAQQSILQVKKGQADYDMSPPPPAAPSELGRRYGVNRSRFFVHPANAIDYVAFNTSRAPFNDVTMRKAVNFALNRPALVRQLGAYAGEPTDQILPPTIRGYRNARIYPVNGPNIARAKALMRGRTAKATLYTSNDPANTNRAEVIRANLKAIGIEVEVKTRPFSAFVTAINNRSEPYDMVLFGWLADYVDPYDFINVLLHGKNITAKNNINTAQFNDPVFNRKMDRAAKLSGPGRYATYGALDVEIMRKAAPWAPIDVPTIREFISSRVGCYVYVRAFAAMSLATACLK